MGQKEEVYKLIDYLFAIVIGLIAGIASFVFLLFLFMGLGLFGWSDGGEKKYLNRLEFTTNLTLIVSILAAIVVVFFVSKSILKSKTRSSQPSSSDNPLP